jgi:hypothetical protein
VTLTVPFVGSATASKTASATAFVKLTASRPLTGGADAVAGSVLAALVAFGGVLAIL